MHSAIHGLLYTEPEDSAGWKLSGDYFSHDDESP
jgi:hypothetical protein